jgi:hypothetical protein
MVSSAVARTVCSSLVGARSRSMVWKMVNTGPNCTSTPSIEVAGAIKLPMSNWMSGRAVWAGAGRIGFQVISSSIAIVAAAVPTAPAFSTVRRPIRRDAFAVDRCRSMTSLPGSAGQADDGGRR